MPVTVTAAVEGPVDAELLQRLAVLCNLEIGDLHGRSGKTGKDTLRQRIRGFNEAAKRAPWVVVVDLDQEKPCAPELVESWLPNPAPGMVFRVAVHEAESWLLADREGLAEYLNVPMNFIPNDPDAAVDPKSVMVEVARHSSNSKIRNGMVPRKGAGRQTGAAYSSYLTGFIQQAWNPEAAKQASPSLASCIGRMKEISR